MAVVSSLLALIMIKELPLIMFSTSVVLHNYVQANNS